MKRLLERWSLWRRPWSIAILGTESGHLSSPLTFLRFRTHADALGWIYDTERRAGLTAYVPVDLRKVAPGDPDARG